MKIENDKIITATENELFKLYLDRGMDDVVDFEQYKRDMISAGVTIIDAEEAAAPVPPVDFTVTGDLLEDAIRHLAHVYKICYPKANYLGVSLFLDDGYARWWNDCHSKSDGKPGADKDYPIEKVTLEII